MEAKAIYLCLVDCSSIQRYVFGSNKVKTNIGASHVVVKIYKEWMKKVALDLFRKNQISFDAWETSPDTIAMQSSGNSHLVMETGYIGGGNALLLFRGYEAAQNFVQAWTRKLMLNAPGIQPVVVLMRVETDLNKGLQEEIPKIFERLGKAKNEQIAETALPRHGITSECKFTTGYSVETAHPTEEKFVSSIAHTKLTHVRDATKYINKKYKGAIGNDRTFATDTSELGQTKGDENLIAIVHIDGNAMGSKFEDECHTLIEKRKLAKRVDEAVESAMYKTLDKFVGKNYAASLLKKLIEKEILKIQYNEENKEQFVPLRPLILNGDDVTFICNARLGFFLAETFMKAFAEEDLNKPGLKLQNPHPSSCAGIAIIKTKYPFYRGYQLAEALCGRAKKKYYDLKNLGGVETSWLDFHISYRGMSDLLQDMRNKHYKVGENWLLWRPWKITQEKEREAIGAAKNAIRYFLKGNEEKESRRWPNSKLKQLARELIQGESSTKDFIAFAEARNLALPEMYEVKTHITGWLKERDEELKIRYKTPYYDILEMMQFYPEILLDV